jgi:hypothetical protein
MKFQKLLRTFEKVLNPVPPVGAIHIDDGSVRLFLLKDGATPVSAAVRLPPGIVEGGRVKDAKNLALALNGVREKYFPKNRHVHVVFSLPAETVYVQSFSIPLLDEEKMNEAANLNLQMISPLEFSKMYAGWQKIGEGFSGGGGQMNLLGAFSEISVTDAFSDALRQAHFEVVAVEFPALALARLIAQGTAGSYPGAFIVNVGSDGLMFLILRNGNLYFSQFHSWRAMAEESGGRNITEQDFETFVVRETQKILNFYSSRWGGTIEKTIIIPPDFSVKIKGILEENFSMKIEPFTPQKFAAVPPPWFSVLGSALRGAMNRSDDIFISLTNLPVKTRYEESRILNFIRIWRKSLVTVTAFIFVIFAVATVFLARAESDLVDKISHGSQSQDVEEIKKLEAQAGEFNTLVGIILDVKDKQLHWPKILARIMEIADGGVAVRRIAINEAGVVFSGTAESSSAFTMLKTRLEGERRFKNIVAPLSSTLTNPNDTVDFTINFDLEVKEF